MKNHFELVKKDKKSLARVGILKTTHGDIQTPSYIPVATKATVKTLDPIDLVNCKSQAVLGNSYHLYLKPGLKIIKKFKGFSNFMGWLGPSFTDSGGYQVSFLRGIESKGYFKISDEKAVFRSYIDGKLVEISPEKSMKIQKILGADMIMAFDQPLSINKTKKQNEISFKRTLNWEERSFKAWEDLKSNQILYGIIQGELNKKQKEESAKFITSLGFPAIAVGGESVGSNPLVSKKSISLVSKYFDDKKPVHALGLGGGPEGILYAVENGVDTFDNTGITRMARSGILFISKEDGGNVSNKFRISIKKSIYKDKSGPISAHCACYTCQNYSSAYIHHLITAKEILGLRLATIHNLYFINNFMDEIRSNIASNNFQNFKKFWLK